MTDEKYIELAIVEAQNSVKAGGAPIGAIMVKDNIVMQEAGVWSGRKKIPARTVKPTV